MTDNEFSPFNDYRISDLSRVTLSPFLPAPVTVKNLSEILMTESSEKNIVSSTGLKFPKFPSGNNIPSVSMRESMEENITMLYGSEVKSVVVEFGTDNTSLDQGKGEKKRKVKGEGSKG